MPLPVLCEELLWPVEGFHGPLLRIAHNKGGNILVHGGSHSRVPVKHMERNGVKETLGDGPGPLGEGKGHQPVHQNSLLCPLVGGILGQLLRNVIVHRHAHGAGESGAGHE